MNGHFFQCRSETTDPKLFFVTLEKLTHYTSKAFKSAANLDPILKIFTIPHINKPVKPELTDAVDIAIFNEDVKKFVKRRNTLTDNVQKLYLIVWGQCTKPHEG